MEAEEREEDTTGNRFSLRKWRKAKEPRGRRRKCEMKCFPKAFLHLPIRVIINIINDSLSLGTARDYFLQQVQRFTKGGQ